MYLENIAREAEASANTRGRSVTEPAHMRVCGRSKSISRSTGKMAGGCSIFLKGQSKSKKKYLEFCLSPLTGCGSRSRHV